MVVSGRRQRGQSGRGSKPRKEAQRGQNHVSSLAQKSIFSCHSCVPQVEHCCRVTTSPLDPDHPASMSSTRTAVRLCFPTEQGACQEVHGLQDALVPRSSVDTYCQEEVNVIRRIHLLMGV
jgi:hypothetical protein